MSSFIWDGMKWFMIYVLLYLIPTWWHHQMEAFSTLLALCAGNSTVIRELSPERSVMWSFDVFFDLQLNKWLIKQLRHQWFETPSWSSWHHVMKLVLTVVCHRWPPWLYGMTTWSAVCLKCQLETEGWQRIPTKTNWGDKFGKLF